MAIDSTVYAADIPAGTYAVGDIVQLECIDGPANVRSGRGRAVLKNILVGQFAATGMAYWRIHVKNSDWIDDVASFTAGTVSSPTAFDDESGSVQSGHDCELTPNSGWQVYAECVLGATTTTANSVFAQIDIDYPQVAAVTNPRAAVGTPATIDYDAGTVPVNAYGTLTTSNWETKNVDYLKAGFEYVLDAVEMFGGIAFLGGFVAFSNAAGMGGLTRIIPITNNPAAIRKSLRYASSVVKGPMDVKLKLFAPTAGTETIFMSHDYVRKRI